MEVLFGLFGGLAIFIFGMQALGTGLQKVAGGKMKHILEVLTTVPVVGVLLGAGVTAVVQSSSLTTVMVVGFVNAGMMTLKQAISVIMGANIGTTITAQIISFNITRFALPIVAIGFAWHFFFKKKKAKDIGYIVFAFGLLLFGLVLMSDSMAPLAQSETFRNIVLAFSQYRILGLLVGLLLTATIQSSSASIGILIALSSQGLLPLEAALPILLGDNIGTCITSVFASIGTKLTAKRAAAAHVLFNIIGSCIFMILMPFYSDLVLAISPVDNIARQIANAHTIFNIVNTILLLPLINIFTAFVIKVLPGEEKIIRKGPIYLDWHNVANPDLALSLAGREVIRMGELAADNLDNSVKAFIERDGDLIHEVEEMEDIVDELEKEITRYMVKVSQTELNEHQSILHTRVMLAINDLERISDHADNIGQMGLFSIEEGLTYSQKAYDEIRDMNNLVGKSLRDVLQAYREEDHALATQVLGEEDKIDAMEKSLRKTHISRLNEGLCFPGSGVIFLDVISNFERVGDHVNNIAHAVNGDFLS